ncbi:hypothetical protein NL676_008972 [Syzygium grande]|nr:hypothetical protein NL676_008972 [Syzygium grande]
MNPLDLGEFRRQGHMVIDFLADYYKNNEKYPVLSQVEPGYLSKCLPSSAPQHEEPQEAILDDINTSTAAILGEMLCAGFSVAGFNWVLSPAATELESLVMDWLRKKLDLPTPFLFSGNGGGVIEGNTTEAIICTLTAARDRVLRRSGHDSIAKLVVYGSDQTHCSFQKAARAVGIDPRNIRAIKTMKSTLFGLSPDLLRKAIRSDIDAGLIPLYSCASVKTTSITAVDLLSPLCEVASEFGMCVHVDAACAGSSCLCPEYRKFLNGVEFAYSFGFNPHKRFGALKLWLVLRSYGVQNLRSHIRNDCRLANLFEEHVEEDGRFEVVFPRDFAFVCFRIGPSVIAGMANGHALKSEHGEEWKLNEVNKLNAQLLHSINASGRVFMTHAVVGGVYILRFAGGATLVRERHVIMAWNVVQEHANSLLSMSRCNTPHD